MHDCSYFIAHTSHVQVKIWSMKDVAAGAAPAAVSIASSTKQQLLAVLSLHNIGVNCVRWSHDGRYESYLHNSFSIYSS
jgi:WD40 repeat protein